MVDAPRTLVYGFHDPGLASAIDQLQRQRVLQVVHWIGAGSGQRSFDEDILQWHVQGVNSEGSKTSAASAAGRWAGLIRDNGRQVVDQLRRNPYCEFTSAAEFPRLIQALAQHFERIIAAKKVEWVVLQNLPHEGFELILYLVAKSLGIPVLMTYQCILPNRFFYCYDLDDFGWFEQVKPHGEPTSVSIPQQFQKSLFYMRNTDSHSGKPNRAAHTRKRIQRARIGLKLWKQRLGWYRMRGRDGARIPADQRYDYDLHRTTTRRISLNQPFVYFPLHLQPELTTSAIGDLFSDQIAALQALSEWVPRDWKILVKENPKQTHRHREPDFFRRMRTLSNVRLLDRTVDTYVLMNHCQFVATVTGTAGWEAITGGKPAVVFGRPWYLTLPGVHHWPVAQRAEWLSQQSVSHEDLEHAVSRLLRKSAVGVVDVAYRAALDNFSDEANAEAVARFLRHQASLVGESRRASA